MTIQDIYTQYKIMPSLQLHQYRVAGVAKSLCELRNGVDEPNIIAACLLHDMGNIIKFKLSMFPDFLAPEGLKYWEKVKAEYHQKYGEDEHEATIEIAKELFNDELRITNKDLRKERVIELIDAIGFSNAKYNFENQDISRKIAAYADMRVEPYGVTSIEHRLEDGHKRFKLHKPDIENEVFFNDMAVFLKKIEQQLFEPLNMEPSDITEESVQAYVPKLKRFEI